MAFNRERTISALTSEIVEKLPAGLVFVERDGAVRIANPTACRFLGLSFDQVRERYVADWNGETLKPDGSVCPVEDYPVSRCLATGEAQGAEVVGVRGRDGDVSWALFSATPLLDGEDVTGAIVLFRDITEQWLAEKRLELYEKHHQNLLKSLPHGVQECGTDGVITFINPAFAHIYGFNNEAEVAGKRIWDFALDDEREEELRQYLAFLVREQPPPSPYVTQSRRCDGRVIDVQVDWTYQRDSDGVLTGFLSIITDITDRLTAQREAMMLKVSRMESVGVLAGGIAHDFNNILTAMMLNISLALNEVDSSGRVGTLLGQATLAADRARRLTQQLLTFAKGGSPVMRSVDVRGLLECADFALRGSNVLCEIDVEAELMAIRADESQVEQVVQNLVINAAQAMPDGGTIELTGTNEIIEAGGELPLEPGAYVRLVLSDHGSGISEEDLARVFEPYFTTKESGSGLGLAVAHSIIQKHGGHLGVRSKLGEGTTFDVYLPASKSPPAAPDIDEPTPKAAANTSVLLMDDDELVRSALGDVLRSHGYEVDAVASGEEAIERYLSALSGARPYAAVIFDLTVRGGMGGRRALEVLLEHDPEIRAIVISGYSEDPVLAEPARFGFRGVLPKPFTAAKVAQVLHAVLS